MTEKSAEIFRKKIGYDLETYESLKRDDVCEEFIYDVVNSGRNGRLHLMDVGYIIPRSASYDTVDLVEPKDVLMHYIDSKTGLNVIGLQQALCVYSTKSKKNLISKSKIKFLEGIYNDYTGNPLVKPESQKAIDDRHLAVWRFCKFDVKIFDEVCEIHNGYELTILNEKMQIEDRAIYIKF